MNTEEIGLILGELKSGQASMSKQIGKLFNTIEGNGYPGIKQRITSVEADVKHIKTLHSECQSDRKEETKNSKTNLIQWLMFVLLVINFVWQTVVHFTTN